MKKIRNKTQNIFLKARFLKDIGKFNKYLNKLNIRCEASTVLLKKTSRMLFS